MTEQPDAESTDAKSTVPQGSSDESTAPGTENRVDDTVPVVDEKAGSRFESTVPDEGEEIPVVEVNPVPAQPAARPSAPALPGADWTRTEPVRDDPGTLGEEARKLWDSVREQFVDPLVRNYPEAAGHLTTAGTELAAALRALVRGAEQRWTNGGEERPDDGRDSPQDDKRP